MTNTKNNTKTHRLTDMLDAELKTAKRIQAESPHSADRYIAAQVEAILTSDKLNDDIKHFTVIGLCQDCAHVAALDSYTSVVGSPAGAAALVHRTYADLCRVCSVAIRWQAESGSLIVDDSLVERWLEDDADGFTARCFADRDTSAEVVFSELSRSAI